MVIDDFVHDRGQLRGRVFDLKTTVGARELQKIGDGMYRGVHQTMDVYSLYAPDSNRVDTVAVLAILVLRRLARQFSRNQDIENLVTTSAVPSIALRPAELLYEDFPAEWAVTRKVLDRYPDGKGTWQPHERSKSLAELATHVADIVNRGTAILTTAGMSVGGRQAPPQLDSARELVACFEDGLEKFNAALAGADLDLLAQPWAIRHGERIIAERPRRVMLRQIMMSHLVHHRAQLGVYYRLLDLPVPGMYGPTADE